MNTDQATGALDRAGLALVTWFLTWAAMRGFISTSDVAQLAPALVVIGGFLLGWWRNRMAAKIESAKSLAADPASPIKALLTTNSDAGKALAASVPDSTVVEAGTPEAAQAARAGT